ncbi:MAG: hypothetical protein J6J12_04065 [Oscillospiraceae bacterium]|nr:hypothetical protein [Oscillospiraceae bacterium]
MKIWLKRISAISLIALLLCAAWQRLVPPSSEECSICRFIKSHAPCLLNLSTGEIGELTLYEPHRTKVGELAEVQQGGTFSFFYAAGAKGTRTTNPWVLTIRVPMEGERIHKSHFCQKCRELLDGYNHGYVLVDLYDKTEPTIYPILAEAAYELRCYSITIAPKYVKDEYEITVTGTLG